MYRGFEARRALLGRVGFAVLTHFKKIEEIRQFSTWTHFWRGEPTDRTTGVSSSLVDAQINPKWALGGTVSWSEGEADLNDDGDYTPLSSARIQPVKLTAYVENQTTPGWRNRLQITALGERDRASKDGVDPVAIDGFVTFDYISSIKLWSV